MTFFSDNLLNNQYSAPLNSNVDFSTRLDEIQTFQNSQTYTDYVDAQNNKSYNDIKTKICDTILCKFNSIPNNIDVNNYELSYTINIEALNEDDKNDLLDVLINQGYTCEVVDNVLTIEP